MFYFHNKNELKEFLNLKNTKLTSNLSEIKKIDIPNNLFTKDLIKINNQI